MNVRQSVELRGAMLLLALACGGGGAALAHAEPACGSTGWSQTPTADDLAKAYPAKAMLERKTGSAVLRCTLARDGALKDCSVETETPRDSGFGAAALSLADKVRAVPVCAGAPDPATGGARIPVRFELPPEPPAREAVFNKPTGRFSRLAPAGPYWPDHALRRGISGATLVDCEVETDNRLRHCHLVAEVPENDDFGLATLRMADVGWMKAGPPPPGIAAPPDGIWRFKVMFPAKSLADDGG